MGILVGFSFSKAIYQFLYTYLKGDPLQVLKPMFASCENEESFMEKIINTNIDTYSTYFTISGEPDGYINRGVEKLSINPLLNNLKIPLFNSQGKYIGAIKYYRFIKGCFHLPIHFLSQTISFLKKEGLTPVITKYEPNPVRTLSGKIKMKPEWSQEREEQKEAFKHLLTTTGSMTGNDLQTGKGKSYIGVRLTTIFECPTLVVCDGLVEQWIDNYIEKTDVDPSDIWIIQGIDSLKKLWDIIKSKGKLPSIVVGSLKTLSRYSQYKDENYRVFPRINELMKALGIGMAIFDEFHLNTHAIVMLLLVLNIRKNVFLSATPQRSDKAEQKIYEIIFPSGIVGGSSIYDRYVDTTMRGYELDLHMSSNKFENYSYGYSHIKYESRLLQKAAFIDGFQSVLQRTIQHDYLNYRVKGETKCLVFVSTVRMAEEMAARLSSVFPGIDVRTYTASDPIDNLYDAEIIISTPKSCGVGKDIKGLITVINTVSMSSQPSIKQMFGRLRKLRDNKQCRFIDLINTCVPQQMRHFWTKRKIYRYCSKDLRIEDIDLNQSGSGNARNNRYKNPSRPGQAPQFTGRRNQYYN